MKVVLVDGLPLHECQLCCARFGDRRAVETLSDGEESRRRGVDAAVWPLARTLDYLPGLRVRSSGGADARTRTLPFIEMVGTDARALVQLENLAKSLRLGARGQRCHWVIEVEFQSNLGFVLKPRLGGPHLGEQTVLDVEHDLDVLRRQVERDQRLSWWRHVEPGRSG